MLVRVVCIYIQLASRKKKYEHNEQDDRGHGLENVYGWGCIVYLKCGEKFM